MANSKNITFDQLQNALTRVKSALDGKANTSHGNHVPKTETANNAKFLRNDNTWQTVTPVNIGAADRSHSHGSYVNQNAFSNIKVGDTTVAADSPTDTLTLTAGANVTLTPDATNDTVTIAAKDTVYTHPTTSGYKHIPSGGSSGQILRWSADGTAAWGSDNNTDTKVTNTLATTTKAYVTGTTNATTNTGTQVFDTGVYLDTTAGKLVATTFAGALSGNASSATNLQTARKFTIGNTERTFNGSADVKWTLEDIGAAASSHTHNYLPLSGGTISTSGFGALYIERNGSTNGASIGFKNSDGTLGYIGMTGAKDGGLMRWSSNTTTSTLGTPYTILDTGNYKTYVTPANIGAATVSHGTHVSYATATPLVAGTAAVGTSSKVAREDHVHPAQINVSGSSGSCTGNAATASELQTARNIGLSGIVTGSANFDGSSNITIATSIGSTPVSGSYFKGVPIISSNGVIEIGKYIDFHNSSNSTADYDTRLQCVGASSNVVNIPTNSGTLALLSDNVASASKLKSAKTLTIGNTGKSFDGSANVAWSLDEIGVTSAIDNIKVGGTNFQRFSSPYLLREKTVADCWTAGRGLLTHNSEPIMGTDCYWLNISSTKDNSFTQLKTDYRAFNIIQGEKYSYSIDYSIGTNCAGIQLMVYNYNDSKSAELFSDRKNTTGQTYKIHKQGTWTATWTGEAYVCIYNTGFIDKAKGDSNLLFDNIKFEKGSIPTSWSPAPQDIDNAIDVVDGKFVNYVTKTDFNNLSIGGTNLQRYSKPYLLHEANPSGYWDTKSTGTLTTISYNDIFNKETVYKLTLPQTETEHVWTELKSPYRKIHVETGKKYTFSLDYVTGDNCKGILINLYKDNNAFLANMFQEIKSAVGGGGDVKRKEIVWTSTYTGDMYIVINNLGVVTTTNGDSNLIFTNLKFEEGNKATAWSPSPYDIDSSITALNNKFANYSTTLDMNTAINNKADSVLSTVSNIYTTKTDFNNLSIGGTNLLLNSDWHKGKQSPWSINAMVTFDTTNGRITIPVKSDGEVEVTQQVDIDKPNIQHTFSVYIYENNIDKGLRFYWRNYDSSAGSWGSWSYANVPVNYTGLYSHTFTPTGSKIHIDMEAYYDTGGKAVLGCFKLEQGNKATAWSPNPKDIDSAITTVDGKFDNYSTTTQMNSAINQKANEITSSVSSTYATKSALNTVDGKFANYSTTSQMNSAIAQKGDAILSTVSNTYTTKTDFNKLSVGCTNLQRFSSPYLLKDKSITNYWTSERGNLTHASDGSMGGDCYWLAVSSGKTDCYTQLFASYGQFDIKQGEKYSYSIDYSIGTNCAGIRVQLFNNGDTKNYLLFEDTKNVAGQTYKIHKEGTWTATWTGKTYVCIYNLGFINTANGASNLLFNNIKIEKGTFPTSWSPAPQDVNANIDFVSDNLSTNYSTTQQMNTAINQKAESITQSVSSTYATKTSLKSANDNITSLTNRMQSAESKLTKDSLTTTIGKYYTTSTDVDGIITNKGYATTSQVNQTATDLTAKFSSAGGYNMVRNGGFILDTNCWTDLGGGIARHSSTSTRTGIYVDTVLPKGFSGDWIKISNGKYYTFSAKVWVANTDLKMTYCTPLDWITNGTASGGHQGGYIDSYTFSHTTIPHGKWVDIWLTFKCTKDGYFRPQIKSESASDTMTISIADIMITEGKVVLPWSPHPYEIYDGINQIDKYGIKVYHTGIDSNSYTHISSSGFYLKYKGSDIFKLDNNGLYINGNAASATKLQTTRSINGTNFDGSANITTTNWGTARTITIGNSGKSVNGSGNVSWSLSEIGAAAASHDHTRLLTKTSQRATSANISAVGDGSLSMILCTSTMTTGKPSAEGHILHFEWDTASGWSSQLLVGGGNNSILQYRGMDSGTWGNWHTVYSTNHKPSPADIGAATSGHNHDSAYLKLSGGTLSGQLTVNNTVYSQAFCVSKNGKEAWFDIGDNDTYIYASGANKSLQITHGGDLNFDGQPVLYGGRGNNYDTAVGTIYFNNAGTSHKGRISCYNDSTNGDYVQVGLRTADDSTNYMLITSDSIKFKSNNIQLNGKKLTIATSAPSNPATGDVWINIG